MENKKLTVIISLVSFILCFIFVSVVIVMIDFQQNTILSQTQLIGENTKIINQQKQNITEYESGEKFIELENRLSTLNQQIETNTILLRENQTLLENKNSELNKLNEELTQAKERLTEQNLILTQQEETITSQAQKLQILSENSDVMQQLETIAEQKSRIESLLDEISQNSTKISAQQENINKLNEKLTEFESLIEVQKQKITEFELVIGVGEYPLETSLTELLSEKQKIIENQENIINEQENTIKNQTELNDSLTQKISEYESNLAEKDGQILTLYSKISELNSKISELEKTITEQNLLLDSQNPSFVVSFIVDGEIIYKEYVKKGEEVANPPTIPAIAGYTAAWSECSKIEENKLIYAIYTPINYTINYDLTYSETTQFRFANFEIEDTQFVVDFLKNTVSFPNKTEILENKFTLNGVEYEITGNYVKSGKKSYPIDGNVVIIDKIYKIENSFISWDENIKLENNFFSINGQTYQINNNFVISNGEFYPIISYSQPSLGFTINVANQTLTYMVNNQQKMIKISNNRFVIDKKTYLIDYVSKCFKRIIGESQFIKEITLPTEFTCENNYIAIPKNALKNIYYLNSAGKLSKTLNDGYLTPVKWEITGINYILAEDTDYIYIVPLEYGDIVLSINWQ